MRVVICGGGVIGACTAYFPSRRGIDVIVVERTEVAAAASGKAGGFLALDLDALARRSFQLHDALRYEIAGDWAYRRMTTYSGLVDSERDARRHVPALSSDGWIDDLAASPRCRLREWLQAGVRPAPEPSIVLRSRRYRGKSMGQNRGVSIPFAMTAVGVRRSKAALSSGCKPHPATAPAGSNRSSHGGNEVAEAFD